MAYFLAGLGGLLLGAVIVICLVYYSQVRHRKKPSLTKYVVFSIAMIILYTIAEFITASLTGTSHDTLTTCFYACFGGEILSCALIKIFKLRQEDN